jgi:phosphoribosyl 1,2-cyclic phosphodiesterase
MTMLKYLKFWGTRGSCPVSGPQYTKFGGNTSCAEIQYGEAHLIIDAGTGIRPLGEELLKKPKPFHLLLSHTHWDHVIGFPFFEPLYSSDSEITIWAPPEGKKSCRQIFDDLMSVEFFPVRLSDVKAKLHFCSIEENTPIQIGPLTIHFRRAHHPSTAYCFKIQTPHQTIGYASDNEMFKNYHGDLMHAPEDPSLVQFFSGCDLLIHEAQYFPKEYRQKSGWGHSSVSNTVALVQKTNIHRWLAIHHDPKHTDDDLLRLAVLSQQLLDENTIPCRSEWIGDGHVVSLT